jgi:hypothetical protein
MRVKVKVNMNMIVQETPQTIGAKGLHACLLAPLVGGRLLAYQGSLKKAQAPKSNNNVME